MIDGELLSLVGLAAGKNEQNVKRIREFETKKEQLSEALYYLYSQIEFGNISEAVLAGLSQDSFMRGRFEQQF